MMEHSSNLCEAWASVDEVAARLGFTKGTVCRWIETKGLPARKPGRFWKFKLSDVDDWARAGGDDDGPSAKREK